MTNLRTINTVTAYLFFIAALTFSVFSAVALSYWPEAMQAYARKGDGVVLLILVVVALASVISIWVTHVLGHLVWWAGLEKEFYNTHKAFIRNALNEVDYMPFIYGIAAPLALYLGIILNNLGPGWNIFNASYLDMGWPLLAIFTFLSYRYLRATPLDDFAAKMLELLKAPAPEVSQSVPTTEAATT